MAQFMVNDEMVEEDGFGGCPTKGQPPLPSKVLSPATTPFMMQASPPLTPCLPHLHDPLGSCSDFQFVRTFSGDSTAAPDSEPMTPFMSFQMDPFSGQLPRHLASFSSIDPPFILEAENGHDPEPEGNVDKLEELLAEVKGLYNTKYPGDHVDNVGHEVGCSQVDGLQDLLQDVKDLYNTRYPNDHVDDIEGEIGYDAEHLEELIEEVKGLYNAKYPFDNVDEADRECGYDADGLLWVTYVGNGVQTQDTKVEELHCLLDEVKGLYNSMYPLDHVEDLLEEVTHLYNERYPLDRIDDAGRYTGQGSETRAAKLEQVEELLEEVKGMYNEKFPLVRIRYTGRGSEAQAANLEQVEELLEEVKGMYIEKFPLELQDLLQEVKMLYNEKYPHDHVDDECEVGLDADGLLWVQNTGHGFASREAKVDELQDLLEEVKTLYNDEFPLDHVDDMGCELGHDADGVLWVQHTGLGLQPRGTNVEELENLLGEVKGLYNQKYPDELHDLLEEVKALYNEKYPLDHVDNEALETVWTGSGRSRTELVDDLLQEVKGLYNAKYPEDQVDDAELEVGTDTNGFRWLQYMEKLEDLLEEVKGLYNERFPQDHADNEDCKVSTDADGLIWVTHTGLPAATQDRSIERLEDMLEEVRGMYNERYPHDHVDALEAREQKMQELEELLAEVQGLYSERYPLDHMEETGHEVVDSDGLVWVAYTGEGSAEAARQQKAEQLESLLEEVKGLYSEQYPLDHVDDDERVAQLEDLLEDVKGLYSQRHPLDDLDDEGHEVGYDADGLLWVQYTGCGVEDVSTARAEREMEEARGMPKMDMLQGMLSEVMRLYNAKYPLDSIDD